MSLGGANKQLDILFGALQEMEGAVKEAVSVLREADTNAGKANDLFMDTISVLQRRTVEVDFPSAMDHHDRIAPHYGAAATHFSLAGLDDVKNEHVRKTLEATGESERLSEAGLGTLNALIDRFNKLPPKEAAASDSVNKTHHATHNVTHFLANDSSAIMLNVRLRKSIGLLQKYMGRD